VKQQASVEQHQPSHRPEVPSLSRSQGVNTVEQAGDQLGPGLLTTLNQNRGQQEIDYITQKKKVPDGVDGCTPYIGTHRLASDQTTASYMSEDTTQGYTKRLIPQMRTPEEVEEEEEEEVC
jgi:hypothetical protein